MDPPSGDVWNRQKCNRSDGRRPQIQRQRLRCVSGWATDIAGCCTQVCMRVHVRMHIYILAGESLMRQSSEARALVSYRSSSDELPALFDAGARPEDVVSTPRPNAAKFAAVAVPAPLDDPEAQAAVK